MYLYLVDLIDLITAIQYCRRFEYVEVLLRYYNGDI